MVTNNGSQEEEKVILKGFLFQAQDGRWILCQESTLKSCCVGALHKHKTQVTLLCDCSKYSQGSLLQVEGILEKAESGATSLKEVTFINKPHFPYWTWGLIAVLALLALFKLKRLLLP